MALIGLLTVVNAGLAAVAPLLLGAIIDEVGKLGGQGSITGSDVIIGLLALSALSSVGYLLISSTSQRLGDLLAARLRKLLTEKFFSKAMLIPQSYYDTETSGKILNQLARGVVTIQHYSNTASNFIFPMLIGVVVNLVVVASFNPWIALLLLGIFPIYISLSAYSSALWGKREEIKNKIEDKLRGRIAEVIGNIKLVRGFNQQDFESSLLASNLSEINKIYHKQSNIFHVFDFTREIFLFVILFGAMLLVINDALTGAISIGVIIVLIQFIDRVRQSLFGMSYIIGQTQMAESGAKEYLKLLELKEIPGEDGIIESTANGKLGDGKVSIEFKDVTFGYDDKTPVLEHISFKLESPSTISLVGPSGAGKSTIINLILKFYELSGGEIFLNDEPYSTLPAGQIREKIALVFQETELFSSSVRENVTYGLIDDVGQTAPSDAAIETALKQANAWEFVSKLPQGLDSEIGERGVRLSGGQKQRLQIARAILRNAPILLLDEATSNLDARSEHEVQEALSELMKGKLVFIVAHRFSTIQNSDQIMVLDDKKIVDQGTPTELASRVGIYAELLKYQLEGQKQMLKKYDLR